MKEDRIIYPIIYSIAKFYSKSNDFNGYPVRTLKEIFCLSDNEAKSMIKRLLQSGKIDCMFGNIHPNPHIKFMNFPPEEQLQFLEEIEFGEHFCLYPSMSLLESAHGLTDRFKDAPYTYELALGAGQLESRFFDLSVLESYRNDPRYSYEDDSVSGSIAVKSEYYESDKMPDHDRIELKRFGYAYDEKQDKYVSAILRYLSKLSREHQIIWETRSVHKKYDLHPDYKRIIWGDFSSIGISIYDAFLEELCIINKMSMLITGGSLFKKTYKDNKPRIFGQLLRSTSNEFCQFIVQLNKIMIENIDMYFFKDSSYKNYNNSKKICMLKEWIRHQFPNYSSATIEKIFHKFNEVRRMRNAYVHEHDENTFDKKYHQIQRDIISDAYIAIRGIRVILSGDQKVKDSPPEIDRHLSEGRIWSK